MTAITSDTADSESLRVMLDRAALGVRTNTPGVVVAVSEDGTTVDVQPTIALTKRIDDEVSAEPLPIVRGVPLMMYGSTSNGLYVVVPIKPGDDGLLVICDRALDNWQYGSGVDRTPDAMTPRHHDVTDAMFYPGAQRAAHAIDGMPSDAVQVRNRDGSTVLSLSEDTISGKVAGGAEMVMTGTGTQFTGPVTAIGIDGGQGSIAVSGDLTIDGTLTVTGNVNVGGVVTAQAFVEG